MLPVALLGSYYVSQHNAVFSAKRTEETQNLASLLNLKRKLFVTNRGEALQTG